MAIKVTGGKKYAKTGASIAKQAATAHIGVLEGATYTGERGTAAGLPVAQVAAYMEFGTEDIEARHPMQRTADKYGPLWSKGIVALIRGKATQPDSITKAVETVSEKAVKDMQQQIQSSNPPPLKPATIANKRRKGRADPEQELIDTGTYQQSIDREIFVKGKKR